MTNNQLLDELKDLKRTSEQLNKICEIETNYRSEIFATLMELVRA